MRTGKTFRAVIVALTCMGIATPQLAMAGRAPQGADTPVPVIETVQDVALDAEGTLRGALVDSNGNPVAEAPVVIGQNGRELATLRTDAEGRFAVKDLKAGTYQVVSHAGAHVYRVWSADEAPAVAKRGIIHVMSPEVARGARRARAGGLLGMLSNPVVLAIIAGLAIAIPLAIDDDDDAS